MPNTYELNGQTLSLTDREARAMLQRLIRETRFRIWNRTASSFSYSYNRWRWHDNERGNPIHWVIEAVGGANLPTATRVNQLKRRHDRLERLLNPNGILSFFNGFDEWQRDASHFRRSMRNYLNDFDAGGGRSVRILSVTRDASFITLQVCAGLLTGGATMSASAAAAAASQGAGTALARAAATNFVIGEIQNGATRVGRSLSGETLTMEDTLREIGNNALSSVGDAMLGEIVGRFIRPLKDQLTAAAMREIRGGRLLRGVGIEIGNDRIAAAVSEAISSLKPADLRAALQEVSQASSARDCAQSTSRNLMRNRNFRTALERRLTN